MIYLIACRDFKVFLLSLSLSSKAFVISFTSEFIPRMVFQYLYSETGTMHGYTNHTLAYFNTSNFKPGTAPHDTDFDRQLRICRYTRHTCNTLILMNSAHLYYLIPFVLSPQQFVFTGTKTIEIHLGLLSLTSFLSSTGLCSLHAWLLSFFSRSVLVKLLLLLFNEHCKLNTT